MSSDIVYLERGRGKVLLYDGFQYHKKKVYSNKAEYWKCALTKKNKCCGSLTIKDHTQIIKKVAHGPTCTKDESKNEMHVRLNKCKKEVIKRITSPVTKIFEETVSGIQNDGLNFVCQIPEFQNVKSGLYKQRNRSLAVKKVTKWSNYEEIEIPPQFQSFVIGDYHERGVYNEKRKRILLFAPAWVKQVMATAKEYFIDGTFRICTPPFTQLVTIHCDLGSTTEYTKIVPLIYALLPDKTLTSYQVLLKILKSHYTEWQPTIFMTDFEMSLIKAIRYTFPNAENRGCYYHYYSALWRKARNLKLDKSRDTRRIICLATVLPLLPIDQVREGWDYIKSEILDDFNMALFTAYFESFWLKSDQFIKQWNSFGLRNRTNNYAEAWHFKINNKRNTNLNLTQLLTKLHAYSNGLIRNKYLKIVNHCEIKKREKKYILRDYVIQNIQMQLITGEIGVGHVLEKLR